MNGFYTASLHWQRCPCGKIGAASGFSDEFQGTRWALSTNSSQFDRRTSSKKAICFDVQLRPRKSGALGSDHQKKCKLFRPRSAAGRSRDTKANALASLNKVEGSKSGVRDLQHFLQHAPQDPLKAFRTKWRIRTTSSIHHRCARHTPRYDILRFSFHCCRLSQLWQSRQSVFQARLLLVRARFRSSYNKCCARNAML